MHGLTSELTTAESLDGELKAWALATQAAHDLEQGHDLVARQRLQQAVELCETTSPLLAAMLLGQAAEIAQFKSELPLGLVQQELRRAIEIAQRHGLTKFEGKLWLQLGLLLQQAAGEHNRLALHESIKALQHALQLGIDERLDPLWFAEIQNSLGLAYLAMPASEASNQLRTGIAIQSFRKALEMVNPTDHPQTWARINMNLANALQHAPSSHPIDNLIQAVEIYEQVLQVRTKERDPVSYALVTINQANALAHLGMFKPALEKAAEAYKLFQWYNQAEQATSARELVESINLCLTRPANHNTATPVQRGVNDMAAKQERPTLEVVADGTL
jgi:tetratricopeptide (TPR) repeat protein